MRAASSEEQNLRQPENPAFKGQRPSSSAEFCPSCREAFDCGKKRRLIDSCGHERCYTCMFSKELCSLCTIEGMCEEIKIDRPSYPTWHVYFFILNRHMNIEYL